MDNYLYFLREIIDKNTIYQFDSQRDNRSDIEFFLENFSNETENKYSRKTYKTLRYLIVDQMYFILRKEEVPENLIQSIFTVAFHENVYYFMMEKVMSIEQAESIKNNIQLLNTKDHDHVKELYIDALKDLDTELDFTFIDIKKRVENDIYFKYEPLDNKYCKIWVISFYNIVNK